MQHTVSAEYALNEMRVHFWRIPRRSRYRGLGTTSPALWVLQRACFAILWCGSKLRCGSYRSLCV
ncbi:hypothetical protein OH492_07570 [Vibrio chagasii]|nr:hypothetical protein [Vibrio chagasii]